MSIFTWFALGLLTGLIIGAVSHQSGKVLALDALLGAIGAIGGGLAFNSFGPAHLMTFNVYSELGALAGSAVVLAGHRSIFHRV